MIDPRLQKELEGATIELKNSLNAHKKSISSMDMAEDKKNILLGSINEIESSLANGSMAQITQLIKNIGKV
jgi:hypothetical protein